MIDLRIYDGVERGRPVTIYFEGEPLAAFDGESLAVALLAAGRRRLRRSPRAGAPRGLLCGMGICHECVVVIDGRTVPSCVQPVRDGMQVFEKRYA
jgi:predicted molibdopterin-dependent oxidoreductase YjgC